MNRTVKWVIGSVVVSMIQNIDKRQLLNTIKSVWNNLRNGTTGVNPNKEFTKTAANSRNFQTQGKY